MTGNQNSIIFLGKFGHYLLSFEEKVLNLQEDQVSEKLIHKYRELLKPDVLKHNFKGCNTAAWILVGDVKPTFLLKNLISKSNIILFVFDLNNTDTLDFLSDGWRPIIDKVDKNDQERIFIGINIQSDNKSINRKELNLKIPKLLEDFKCDKYFEFGINKNSSPPNKIGKFQICQNCLNYIKSKLNSQAENINDDKEQSVIKAKEGAEETNIKIESSFENKNEQVNKDINELNQLINSKIRIQDDEQAIKTEKIDENRLVNAENKNNESFEEQNNDQLKKLSNNNCGHVVDEIDFQLININNIVYKISTKNQTAKIHDSSKAEGNFEVQEFVEFNNCKYFITDICDKAFCNSKIKSLTFSSESKVKRIGNYAFENSQLQQICIPKSLEKLDKYWCAGANMLSELKVDNKNRHFNLKNGLLIYHNESSNEILFVSREISRIENMNDYFHFGCYAFNNCNNINFITCKNSTNHVIHIDEFCFAGANNLQSITVDCVKIIIGDFCFKNCKKLNYFSIKNVEILKLGSYAFDGCSKIDHIYFAVKNKIDFGDHCFNGAENLRSISITTEEVCFGDFCFFNCISFTSISFYKVKNIRIGSNSFTNCSKLNRISISCLDRIDLCNNCFAGMLNIESVSLSSQEVNIGDFCFRDCNKLSSISINQAKNTKIGSKAFSKCDLLNRFDLSVSSNIEIGDHCFSCLKNLQSISLSCLETIDIGQVCFENCPSLFLISINKAKNANLSSKLCENCGKLRELNIQIQRIKLKDKLVNESSSNIFQDNSIEFIISKNTFQGCNYLSKVLISCESSLLFQKESFIDKKNLNNVEIHGSQIIFEENCFKNCFSISKNANISDYNRKLLNQVKISSTSSIEIGKSCFDGSLFLNKVELLGKKIIIKKECFSECTSLNSFCISKSSMLSLEDHIFKNCMNLNSISLQNSDYIKLNANSLTGCNKSVKFSINPTSKSYINDYFEQINDLQSGNSMNNLVLKKKDTNDLFMAIVLEQDPRNISQYINLLNIDDTFAVHPIGFGFIEIKNKLHPIIITQYYDNCSLENSLKNKSLSGTQRYIILLSLAQGLKYIHSLNIICKYMSPNNIYLDEYFIPHINYIISFCTNSKYFESKYQSPETLNSGIFTKESDIYSFSFIAYELLVGTFLEKGTMPELKDINDSKIFKFFTRCWSLNPSFRPPIDDIIEELKNERYMQLMGSSKQDVIEFLNKYDSQNNDTKEYNYDLAFQVLGTKDEIEITKSPNVIGNIFIPRFILHKSKKYNILKIGKNAFERTQIKSLSFSLNSNVKSIGNYAFDKSSLKQLYIPASVEEIDKYWCAGAEKLSFVYVDSDNFLFSSEKGILHRNIYSDDGIISREILFVPRNHQKDFLISPDISCIGSYSFYSCNNLSLIVSESSLLHLISSYSFYRCKKLERIILNKSNNLIIEKGSFNELNKLKSIEIKSDIITFQEGWIQKCPSISSISIHQSQEFVISPNLFKGFDAITNIKLISDSFVTLPEECFKDSKIPIYIEIIGKQVVIGDYCFNYSYLKSITVNCQKLTLGNFCFSCNSELKSIKLSCEEIIIGQSCFKNCKSLPSYDFNLVNVKNLQVGSYAFEGCEKFAYLYINVSEKIEVKNKGFSGISNLTSITFVSKEANLGNYCFDKCIKLEHIYFQKIQNSFLGTNIINDCQKIQNFDLSASSSLIVSNCCFANASNLRQTRLIGGSLYIGNRIFQNCNNIKSAHFQSSISHEIDEYYLSNCSKHIKVTCNFEEKK